MNRKGEILIGAKTVDRFGSPIAAILLFDEANCAIGLRPSNLVTKNAYPLKAKGAKYRHRIIQASKFCRAHNIQVDRLVKFTTPEIDDEGRLVLDLKKTIPIGK